MANNPPRFFPPHYFAERYFATGEEAAEGSIYASAAGVATVTGVLSVATQVVASREGGSSGIWIRVGDDGEHRLYGHDIATRAPTISRPSLGVSVSLSAMSLTSPAPQVGHPKLRRDDINEVLEIIEVFKIASMMKAA